MFVAARQRKMHKPVSPPQRHPARSLTVNAKHHLTHALQCQRLPDGANRKLARTDRQRKLCT